MADEKETKTGETANKEAEPKKSTTRKRRSTTRKRSTSSKKVQKKIEFVKSKRKSAVARASSRDGSGIIRLNGFDINVFEPIELRRLMLESLSVSKAAYDESKRMDIKVSVHGGGQSSQAQAVRSAIAKSIVALSKNESIKGEFMHYDRFMLIDDSRRVEPKKFKGPKARARFQKSYR